MKFNWTLNTISHTCLDRIKLAFFFLNPKNRWSLGEKVKTFEKEFADFLGVKYVVATSSGSTANTILAEYWKDSNIEEFNTGKNQVIFNAITWSTNINPWIRNSYVPVFIDINLKDFSINYHKLEEYLYKNHNKVSCLFITSLIGYSPNIDKLEEIARKYKVKLMFDCCESSLSKHYSRINQNWESTCKNYTHTHSFFIGHLLNGCEMGCIATNSEKDYQEFLMYRNHGLIRVIKDLGNVNIPIYSTVQNNLVDDLFSFARVGNNYRPIEINAYIASLDLKRVDKYKKCRKLLFDVFFSELDSNKYFLPFENSSVVENSHFCLPIIINPKYDKNKYELISSVKEYLKTNKIEYRPIISQNAGRQLIYKKYCDYRKFDNAEYLSNFGCYVGLHTKLKEKMVKKLVKDLNNL